MTAEATEVGVCSCCGADARVNDLVLNRKLCLRCYGAGCDGKHECQHSQATLADLDQRDCR